MAIKNGNYIPDGDSGGEVIITPLEPKGQWMPIDNIRTMVFIVVREILDEGALRDALDNLIRNHLPILGAGIESNSKARGLVYQPRRAFLPITNCSVGQTKQFTLLLRMCTCCRRWSNLTVIYCFTEPATCSIRSDELRKHDHRLDQLSQRREGG